MFKTLILTQGRLADELLVAAQKIQPKSLPNFEALGLAWDASPETSRRQVAAAIERLDLGEGVLILTDVCGSTPSNLAIEHLNPSDNGHALEVLTGVNLMTVLRLSCLDQTDLSPAEAAKWLQEKTRGSICIGSDMAINSSPTTAADSCAPESSTEGEDRRARGGRR